MQTAEHKRLGESRAQNSWQNWGPYLSERQWGTVREDYSEHGTAWSYLSHDHARSRAYRWGEDGIAGICDFRQTLCLALAMWNGNDPILKERLFGLTNEEGNHGEDVKELYYYMDAAPSHAYLKMLYKYPHKCYPYAELIEENARRGIDDREFEILDTDAFEGNRYFDITVEYAQATPGDVLMLITAENRGPDAHTLHLVPQIWYRNTWSWLAGIERPFIREVKGNVLECNHAELGAYYCYLDSPSECMFTHNETNPNVFGEEAVGYFKDAFHERVIRDDPSRCDPDRSGTKAGFWCCYEVPPGGSQTLRLRLTPHLYEKPFARFNATLSTRRRETDQFYESLQHEIRDADLRLIQRQAFAGLVWSKQFYNYDVRVWLEGDSGQPAPPEGRKHNRNSRWRHLNNADVLSMPDKWEYPWYAAWDLAFHCVPLASLDPEFAKGQLELLTKEWFMHPSGQLPAYEWAFDDVNPPVHAWATWRVFQVDRRNSGSETGDLEFLERVFHKLLLNFTWWVNRKDVEGRNVFQGGFLGLDNIGVFDRNAELPTGGHIDQADGTSWMAMFSLNLLRIALELAQHNHVYEDIATKFFEHFLHIAEAMNDIGEHGIGLWDEEDEFYYDVLHLPDGFMSPMKLRSMVGLVPLFAVEVLEPELLARVPEFNKRLEWFLDCRPDLAALVSHWDEPGRGKRRLLSLLRGHRMKRLLHRMLDESEFLSPWGVRAMSRCYKDNPYVFRHGDTEFSVRYEPGESRTHVFGGNSNWRGPVWFPVNYLIIESLQRFHHYYGDDFLIECPTHSGNRIPLDQIAIELSRRQIDLFRRDKLGERPVFGGSQRLNHDPDFRDLIPFYEYFDADTGRGVGASHQTGWTGLVAKLIAPRRSAHPKRGQS